MGMVRVVPTQENGRVAGLTLFGIRPDTLLGQLGFEPGDRLQTVNGFDVTNAENAMQALARLRTADHLTVQVNRRGRDTNLDFNVK
jgi:general secretion pathway protein C